MATTVSLTKAEFKVLIERLNNFADRGIDVLVRMEGERRWEAPVKPLIKKFIRAGVRSGDLKIPSCYKGPDPEE